MLGYGMARSTANVLVLLTKLERLFQIVLF